jgi:3'5'-cyclic nucleotide phosphodiesterase
MSQKCDNRTHAPQQTETFSIAASARTSSVGGTVRPSGLRSFGSVPTGVFRLPVSSQNGSISPPWRWSVKTITALAANKLGKFLAKDFRRVFGPAHDDMAERLGSLARSTIECLARSDALYHNFEHTLQVTMVGRDILAGMTLSQRIEPTDYSHLIVACLLHDIGYGAVRNVVGIRCGALSGNMRVSFQAARSIG